MKKNSRMSIEILQVSKDKKKYKVLTTEGEFKFDEETIIKHLVFKGKKFTCEEFEEIQKTEEESKLFNATLNYISYQMRSEWEIYSYLQEKGAIPTQISTIIEKIKSFGYINDEMLASITFESVVRNEKGPKLLEQKLREKKIDEMIIINTISKYDKNLEIEVLDKLILKLQDKRRSQPIKKQKQVIYEKLLRDGFSNELVNYVVNHIDYVDESDETLKKEIERLKYKYRELDNYQRKSKIINNLISKGYEYSNINKYLNE